MIKQLLMFLGLVKRDNTKPKSIGGYEIKIDGLGFYDIKIGDKFEGAGCGHFFRDQTCNSVGEGVDGMVIGTTSLVSFRKCNIRPIKENSIPPHIETYGKMKEYEQELIKSTGVQ